MRYFLIINSGSVGQIFYCLHNYILHEFLFEGELLDLIEDDSYLDEVKYSRLTVSFDELKVKQSCNARVVQDFCGYVFSGLKSKHVT